MSGATGLFIALEGGEGSGKSTQAAALADWLRARGRRVVVTREPGGTAAAEAIRAVILSDELHGSDAWCEALLFAAARADHVRTLIQPALERGDVVICDRFVDSSVAYQGVGRGLGIQAVRRANEVAVRGVRPHLTVVLDVEPEVGLSRAKAANRMEAERLSFHYAVRGAFLDFAAADPQRYLVVRTTEGAEAVTEAILAELAARGLFREGRR